MSKVPFKLLGLTPKHKDFLQRYAQKNLGSSSRTKAIITIIEKQMELENEDIDMISTMDSMRNIALEDKQKYIENYQMLIRQRDDDVKKAKDKKDYALAKKLQQKRLSIEKKRIQFSLPIYDYDFINKLAEESNSSIQYYIMVVLHNHLYKEKRLLGNEIEMLKKSNYELFKIGVNVNQIAKANNMGDMIDLPMNQLYKFIQNHVKIVQNIINSSTNIY